MQIHYCVNDAYTMIPTKSAIDCPKSDTHFEKIIGLRPSSDNAQLLVRSDDPLNPVTLDCLAQCESNERCISFVLHYDTQECYWFDYDVGATGQEIRQVIDNEAAWFVKTCLKGEVSCDKLWMFERVPGSTLIGNDTKTLPQNMSRTECQQKCLDERAFRCRSVNFKAHFDYEDPESNVTTGTCVLSDSDRYLMPNSYRVSTYDDEYFENQCIKSRNTTDYHNNEFCAYEEYENVILSHVDLSIQHKTKEECQRLCESTTTFNCRGFSVIRGDSNLCFLHSEDSKLHGPKLLKPTQNAAYYEKARCLNVSVSCSETFMTISYRPELDFRGKLYMQGNSENPACFAWGQGSFKNVTLKLPLLTSQCGIIKADSPNNRTLLAGTLIIQYNALIQTRSDRIIKVGCIFGNDSKVLIGTGVKITSSLPNKGSTLLNTITNETVAPMVVMKIIDIKSQEEAIDTQIGQELQLVIELKEKTNSYDFWANHLIAMTENGDESIFLLDDRGCPSNLNIFPAITKQTLNGTRRLTGTFEAFKFASSPVVRFSVIIQFCPDQCPAVDCGNSIQSFGRRRKREVSSHVLETINGNTTVQSKIPKIKPAEEAKTSIVNQMPLEYVMVVRNPNSYSDRLIFGDKDGAKILVAGYNYKTNEVCLDYSLVLGLIITWIIVQLIFIICCIILVRRYKKYYEEEYTRASMEELHKNFGIGFSNLENRRVHWADNDDMM
ncbi:uncharacterized protein LOC143199593 isoform X2 [Rhynchophorus ferrugineus]|uniref:uncharacterized protein LOC143199593 isoform X2 n=1 Tax=Rhynchophorus ferrugineus TaxID=354439 RepID=UPI003FCC8416